MRVLCVDHIFGGGRRERLSIGNTYGVWRKVLKDEKGLYQVLCHNCNWIKRSENANESGGGRKREMTKEKAA